MVTGHRADEELVMARAEELMVVMQGMDGCEERKEGKKGDEGAETELAEGERN